MLRRLVVGVATAISLAMAFPSYAATFGDYGDTFDNGTAFDLTSYSSSGAGYSGLYIIPTGALTLSGITQLSADYNMLSGPFAGGSPRFGIADANDKQVYAYWGTPTGGGSFSNPNPNGTWANTGNFADPLSSDLRFYSNGFGGLNSPNTGLTWAQLLAAVGATEVAYVVLDLDGGFAGDQHMLVNNFALNGDVLAVSEVPLPAALPLLLGGLGAIGYVARRRKNKNAA